MDEEETYHIVDTTLKRIIRYDPAAFLKLAGMSVSDKTIRFEDASVIQKEFRADHVCILSDELKKDVGGVYLEYQLIPKLEDVRKWIIKWIGLNDRLPYPVALLAVYLHRGKYASFHSEFSAQVGIDEEVADLGSVVFQVWSDGEKLFDSGTLTGTSPALPVDVSLEGRQDLRLFVGANGDTNHDHADWAEARLTCN